jgi:hypothetical protein
MSISVISRPLPGKSNLVIAQDAAIPNTMFAGTLIAATRRVSLIAATASGSATAARKAGTPRRNASTNTVISGSSRNTARKPSALAISIRRVQTPCWVGEAIVSAPSAGGSKPASG